MTELIETITTNKKLIGSFSSLKATRLSFKGSFSNASLSLHRFTENLSLATIGLSLLVLILSAFFPAFAYSLMQKYWVGMSPQVAFGYGFLALALFTANRNSKSRMGQLVLRFSGGVICLAILVRIFFPAMDSGESPFTYAALFGLGLSFTLSTWVGRQRKPMGDVLGATILFVIVSFIYFLICYCHGVRSLLDSQIPCPHLISVICTVLLSGAILGSLGPAFFPTRPFVGPSVRASLLRKSLPITIAVILVFVCVEGIMPVILSPPLAAFLTLIISSLIVIYLILQSSSVVGRQLETALQESQQNYLHLVRGLKDHAVFLLNSKGEILIWNEGAELLTGYKSSEVLGESVCPLFNHVEPRFELAAALEQVMREGEYSVDGWIDRKGHPQFWAETSFSKLVDPKGQMIGVSVIMRDATQRRKSENSMRASLIEKEVMLKEIHHRVKNNLQVISSLLRLQSETVRDKATAALFLDSQERVRAMSMVHEYLYKSPDLARINFPAYVASLVRNLYRTFGLTASENPPVVEVDDVHLSLDVAVPCGLLLTELISNAVKYAYPNKKSGPVTVSFRARPNNMFELSVADSGVGFPENFNWLESDTLGLRLIRLLNEQLRGNIVLESDHGVKFILTFKDQEGRQ